MKKILFLAITIALFSCEKKETKVSEKAKISIQKPVVGADTDSHGCKTTAGYTWSELRGECVRIFEAGTMLTPEDNAAGDKMPAFVIFKDNKAEVFIQTEKPFIMEGSSEYGIFKYGDWELHHLNDPGISRRRFHGQVDVLYKSGKALFKTIKAS